LLTWYGWKLFICTSTYSPKKALCYLCLISLSTIFQLYCIAKFLEQETWLPGENYWRVTQTFIIFKFWQGILHTAPGGMCLIQPLAMCAWCSHWQGVNYRIIQSQLQQPQPTKTSIYTYFTIEINLSLLSLLFLLQNNEYVLFLKAISAFLLVLYITISFNSFSWCNGIISGKRISAPHRISIWPSRYSS
jgi:hypothetical protein